MSTVNLTPYAFLDSDKGLKARRLAKLSGMAFAQCKYTPDEWLEKCGEDPRDFGSLIGRGAGGMCVWTDAAEGLYRQYINAIKMAQHQIGL